MNNIKNAVLRNRIKGDDHETLNFCGCVAKTTLIRMADGSEKQVQDIRVGDRVVDEQFNHVTVITIYSGVEEYIHCIRFIEGNILRATTMHPVFTEIDLKPIKDLKIGEIVKTSDGTQVIQSIDEEKYKDMVYNFELDGESHLMICDGIIVGDFIAETMNKEKAYTDK